LNRLNVLVRAGVVWRIHGVPFWTGGLECYLRSHLPSQVRVHSMSNSSKKRP
jgi:hypothetical protein